MELVRPQRSYLVCATPRSGSTLLCRTLADLGIAGVPEEYFEARIDTGAPRRPSDHLRGANDLFLPEVLSSDDPPKAPDYSRIEPDEDYREHLRRTFAKGTTPNGVFAPKLMWTHLADFLPLARRRPRGAREPAGPLDARDERPAARRPRGGAAVRGDQHARAGLGGRAAGRRRNPVAADRVRSRG